MPYTPTADAHWLHQLIVHPDLLPNSYAETVANPVVGDVGETQFQLAEEEEDDDHDPSIWDEREAILTLNALDVSINFLVTNYGLLWAKAEKFCVSIFLSDALDDLLAWLTSCDQHIIQPTSALLDTLEDDLHQAKWHLIFAMYLNDANPHDVIHLFVPEMHDNVYQDCVHCDSNVEEDDKVDPPNTMLRLYAELVEVGLHQFDFNLSIDQARFQLVCAEGMVESYRSELNAVQSYNVARDHFRQALMPLSHDFHVVSHQPSVMGVPRFQTNGL